MIPNVTDIANPTRVAFRSRSEGISFINTIMSVMGINIYTLWHEPCVEGYSTPGGYSSKFVHPISLGKVMFIAQMMKSEFPYPTLSLYGIGGVENGGHVVEFILLGANIVHVCIGVMIYGYLLIKKL
jgi:dihydropyrimidine dehydrogenase (NADP+)